MRKFLLLFFASALMMAQETVSLSMGSSYSNEVYFKFSNGASESYGNQAWDVAFLRISNFNQAIRINDGKGLNVYEASTNLEDWDTLDLSAADGDELYNSPMEWEGGAFNTGSASYGWGEYNPVTHQVTGSVIFLVENSVTSEYYKFFIENYYGGYTFKYAMWNGSGWDTDQTSTVLNTTNDGHYFNFFSFNDNDVVEASPAGTDWDIVFKRYTDIVPAGPGVTAPYLVTGVLQNKAVEVAKVEEATDATWADTNALTFSEDINSIGYNWKALNASWSYDIVENQVFYVKSNDIVYRMFFNSFAGSSTGDLSFTYEAENLSVVDAAQEVKFAVYPNPVKNNQITLVYDNARTQSQKAMVEIYNVAGQRVFSTSLNNASGLFQRNIQLNNLKSGVYFLKFVQGNDVKTEKLLIQ